MMDVVTAKTTRRRDREMGDLKSTWAHNINDWRKSCCCLALFNTIVDGSLDARVGGVWLAPKSDGCPNGERLRYCPHCSSKIHTSNDGGWDWWFDGSQKAIYRTNKED